MKIFRYLKPYWYVLILVLGLLGVQAFSDLSLPNLTSDIVDTGIMQGGIESATPSEIRKDSLATLELFMTEKEQATVEANYQLNEKGIYKLKENDDTSESKLEKSFEMPMLIVSQLSQEKDQSKNLTTIIAAYQKGLMTKEDLLKIRVQADEKAEDISDSTLRQSGIAYVKAEYKALGKDLKQIQMNYMLLTGAKMIGLTFLSVVASIIVALIASYLAALISKKLRIDQYERTLEFSNAEMNQFSAASLITRNTNDIQQIQMGLVLSIRLVLYAPILGLGGIYMVMKTETSMGWIVGVAVGLVLLIVLLLVGTTMPKFKKLQKLVDRVNLVSREILTGLPVIRAFSREKFEEKRFDQANENLMKTQLFVNRAMTLMMPLMMLLMNVVSAMIVWFGGHNISDGTMQVGDMMAFITYTMQIVMAFMMLSMVSIILPRSNVAAERVDEVINTKPSIIDPKNPVKLVQGIKGLVSFENVSFHFPDATENVLEDISFTARPGETTAIIGSTGSGKSTIVNLIPRFYDVTSGKIKIDDVDIREMTLFDLHNQLGFVPQKGTLFSGDIESNIKFGAGEVSDEAMKRAADIAQASEFISQNEAGFTRPISQGGNNVSGGQKQRLSIARAIAKQPQILIFDDSFSALDNQTDIALRKALEKAMNSVTTIIVAQKISTIMHAEQIVVLNEGKVSAIGTHETLMKTSEIYQEIAKSQLNNQELGIEEAD
ncbi:MULTISPECIES: ABC transporter ATP-binding protein [unclassified Enterococcus]|uniref:ABC transporter ATP-binding protein n=1 Tax=unclassified Enterococcus TaxID=2608891 RepID=UPI0015524C5D|nr:MULTISPECIES: ABC transporter ATP-binding protein [unclassified Enterococcus]MBS7576429.1 ABC transporter ATP-binding protein [Enterococcus sp. MMGLQ5-2]MBS7583661.1 ABC transporter ATP-binding protein [Enterococcus sp. MMGLQ5-1]NPD11522.1 ABC transporter ATP-binding protein [Enterococcus sp. MMGLQ5-1]NPD36266.1 ABC transporter ATP-binding protein [Enterococcus sp. MMGLQ5-2]